MDKTDARYHQLVKTGELKPDPDQAAAAAKLADIQAQLEAVPPRGSTLWRFLGKKPDPVRGLYLWGGVGRGKSMLMDLFFDAVQINRKRRAHFHEFMLDIHARLKAERAKEKGDPIPPVVEALADEARLLCFDEMVVNNMADAAIMSRLFAGLFDAGVTVVTTSNRHPDDLYKDGLNRQLFLPFIALVKQRLDVMARSAGQCRHLAGAQWGGGYQGAIRNLFPPDRLSARGSRACAQRRYRCGRRAEHACAQGAEGRSGLLFQAAVRRGPRRGGLSCHCTAFSHGDDRWHTHTWSAKPQ
jgi:hypothetical protein